MTLFLLKLIAMATMVIDHTGEAFANNNTVMRVIGLMAFPIYAFLIAEGYFHLREKPERLRVHVIKLLILAIVTEPFHDLFVNKTWLEFGVQNAVFTLLLGFITLIACGFWKRKHGENKAISLIGCVLIVAVTSAVSYLIKSEFYVSGIVFIVLSYVYLCKEGEWRFPKRLIAMFGISVVYVFLMFWAYSNFVDWEAFCAILKMRLLPCMIGCCVLTVIPLSLYNRKLGYHAKWFGWLYSVFYPLQFAVLALISFLTT